MRTWWLALSLLVLPLAAPAQDASLQYRLTEVVTDGTPATLTLVANADLGDVSVTLSPDKGKGRTFKVGKLLAGEQKELTFPVPKGESRWRAALAWREGAAKGESNAELVINSLPRFDVQMDKKDIQLEERRAVATPTRALSAVEIVIRDRSGEIAVERRVDLPDSEAGKPVEIRWDMPAGTEAAVADFKFHDQHEFWTAVRVAVWSIDIPHEDVVFETAKWDVRAEEAHKLDQAIQLARKEMARFERDLGKAGIKVEGAVYVAGYTDTVGGSGDNLALSEKRARAIAEYFKKHGIGLPVYYQGFGESVLAVSTADETDEAKNRRAAYVLASAPPSGGQFPGAAWRPLR